MSPTVKILYYCIAMWWLANIGSGFNLVVWKI